MMFVKYDAPSNTTFNSLANMIDYVNSVVTHGGFAGLFGLGLLIMVFGIAFLGLTIYPFDKRVLSSLFITFVFSLLLSLLSLVDAVIPAAILILIAVAWFLVKE